MSTTSLPAVRGVLRLHRAALAVWGAGILAGVAVILYGHAVWADQARVDTYLCRKALEAQAANGSSMACGEMPFDFSELVGLMGAFTVYVGVVVAAFAGGALIGREMESGTAHLAWTQSVSPARWLAMKLAVPAAVIAATVALLSAFTQWTMNANSDIVFTPWYAAESLLTRGPAATLYALCGLAVGALAGLLFRRTLIALAAGAAAMAVVCGALQLLRPFLWPAETIFTEGARYPRRSHDDLYTGEGFRAGSELVPAGSICSDARLTPDLKACMATEHLDGRYVTYHPPSHAWPLHLVESGIVLALALLATAACFLLLRSRTAQLPTRSRR